MITFSTQRELQLIQITDKVKEEVEKTKIKDGTVNIYTPHATGAIIINESADPAMRQDILDKLKQLFPKAAGYKHDQIDNNAHSHLMSTFLGCNETVPLEKGEMKMGTWQDISFVETDGPRKQRKIHVKVLQS